MSRQQLQYDYINCMPSTLDNSCHILMHFIFTAHKAVKRWYLPGISVMYPSECTKSAALVQMASRIPSSTFDIESKISTKAKSSPFTY